MPRPPAAAPKDMTFGDRLRSLRQSRGVTLRWVGKEAAISNTMVSQLEHNQALPSATTLERLADVFGFTMDELWRGIGRGADVPPYAETARCN